MTSGKYGASLLDCIHEGKYVMDLFVFWGRSKGVIPWVLVLFLFYSINQIIKLTCLCYHSNSHAVVGTPFIQLSVPRDLNIHWENLDAGLYTLAQVWTGHLLYWVAVLVPA